MISKLVPKFKLFILAHSDYPSTSDKHFNKLLRVFYFLGFYHKKSTQRRKIFEFFMFSIIFMNTLFSFIIDLYYADKKVLKIIASVLFMLRNVIVNSELIYLIIKQTQLRNMIEDFHSCLSVDGAVSEPDSVLCDKLIAKYKIFILVPATILILTTTILSIQNNCAAPSLYKYCRWKSFIISLNSLCLEIGAIVVISTDLLPIISMLKLEAIVTILCRKIEKLDDNERNLDDCIQFHSRIIMWVLKYKLLKCNNLILFAYQQNNFTDEIYLKLFYSAGLQSNCKN